MSLDGYLAVATTGASLYAAIVSAYAFAQAKEIRGLRDMIAKFDRDGDGKPGGSKRRSLEDVCVNPASYPANR